MPMLVVRVDEGWAWGSVIGSFLANIVVGGLGKSFGLVMKEFRDVFECPASYVTLTGGLIYSCMYAGSLVVHFLSAKVGPRVVVAIGGFGAGSCIGIAAFVDNVFLWIFFIGFGVGSFLSCIFFSSFVVVGQCFDKHLGLASGISVSGVSVGQVVFPPIVSYCIERYSVRGATLIAAGLILHLLIASVLMPSKIIRKPTPTSNSNGDRQAPAEQSKSASIPPMIWGLFALFTVSKIFADIGDIGLSFMFPFMGTERGLTNMQMGWAISFGGGMDLVSRLFVGWFSDRKIIKDTYILFAAWVIDALNGVFMAFTDGLGAFVTGYIIYGGCTGTSMGIFIVVLTGFVTTEHLSRLFGVMMLVMGLILTPGQLVFGIVRDISGTYVWSLVAASIFVLIGAFVLILEKPWRIFLRRKFCPDVPAPVSEELVPFSIDSS